MKKILIVDDNPINSQILKWMLKGEDRELVTLQTHRGIEKMLDQVQPDLLVMDIKLDGANGCEICTELKMNPSYSSLPILLTSSNEEYYDEDCRADGFISKPYNKAELLESISPFI